MRRTFPTQCPWCKAEVFYHTNGNGDCVYFDDLTGAPWPVHNCWEQSSRHQSRAERAQDIQRMQLSVLKEVATGVRPVNITPVPGESTVDRIIREGRARKKAYQEFARLQAELRHNRRESKRR